MDSKTQLKARKLITKLFRHHHHHIRKVTMEAGRRTLGSPAAAAKQARVELESAIDKILKEVADNAYAVGVVDGRNNGT